ncbi:hypothetical protein D3C75_1193600 [compost metagenome]
MQAFTAQIQRYAGHIALQEYIDANVRLLLRYRRALFNLAGKTVDNGVLDLQCAILAVADLFVNATEVNGESFIHTKNARPVDRLYAQVQIQIAVYAEFIQRQQNT